MLQRIWIRGLASLGDVTLEPGPLTVLIGANGSGKSNVLRALKLASVLPTRSLGAFVADSGGASSLLHLGAKRTPVLHLLLDFLDGAGDKHSYAASVAFAAGDRLVFELETVGLSRRDAPSGTIRFLGRDHWESRVPDEADGGPLVHHLSKMASFHLNDTSANSGLRTLSRTAEDIYLASDGRNLAAVLARLSLGHTDDDAKAWRRINQLVRRVAPMVKELRPSKVGANDEFARLDWVDDHDMAFGVHQLSDGTLRAIALITALVHPLTGEASLVCIDEPELGLHPAAISLLAELARSVSSQTQVMFATQSSAFLDHFDPPEVVVVERENGASVLRRLDPAALASWLEDYCLSEIYDKGVIGGRP
jgi:predicted ATPase